MPGPAFLRHHAFGLASGAFSLLLCASLLAGALSIHAQTIPNIRGVYQGSGLNTATCPDGTSRSATDQITITIPSQQGQAFMGTIAVQVARSATVVVDGTVDPQGQLTGTYNYNNASIAGNGTFTGQIGGHQLQLNLTGTATASGGPTCNQTFMATATLTTSTGSMADLSITGFASLSTIASGAQLAYTLTVSNAGPDDATGVLVSDPTPQGTTFAAAASNQGQVEGPAPGGQGNITYLLGTLAKGATATVTLTANVLAAGGSTLINAPFVTSDILDPKLGNNSTTLSTPVAGGAVIKLVWDQPAPTAADPTPAPENLRIVVVGLPGTALDLGRITPQGSCTLVDVNIYKSDQPNVQAIPGNLWETVPPDMLQATMAVAPSGSFYVITNVWNCGGTIIESGPSNQASVPAGPDITKLKVSAKLKAFGTGFSGPVQVLVDGVGFVKKAVLQGSTTIVQKGTLTDGTPIKGIGVKNSVLVTIVNQDGGVGTFAFKRP
jgi:uncharacterized repeat protein (TIGR01451 family)